METDKQRGAEAPGGDHQERLRSIRKRLPWFTAVILGALWSVLYLLFGVLHGMWGMFDTEFPFLFSSLLSIHRGDMPAVVGASIAFADGAAAGLLAGWLFCRFIRKQ